MGNQKPEVESKSKKESDISGQKSISSLSNNHEIQPTEQSISNNETLNLAKEEAIKSLPEEVLNSLVKGFSMNKEGENSTSSQQIPDKEINSKSSDNSR